MYFHALYRSTDEISDSTNPWLSIEFGGGQSVVAYPLPPSPRTRPPPHICHDGVQVLCRPHRPRTRGRAFAMDVRAGKCPPPPPTPPDAARRTRADAFLARKRHRATARAAACRVPAAAAVAVASTSTCRGSDAAAAAAAPVTFPKTAGGGGGGDHAATNDDKDAVPLGAATLLVYDARDHPEMVGRQHRETAATVLITMPQRRQKTRYGTRQGACCRPCLAK